MIFKLTQSCRMKCIKIKNSHNKNHVTWKLIWILDLVKLHAPCDSGCSSYKCNIFTVTNRKYQRSENLKWVKLFRKIKKFPILSLVRLKPLWVFRACRLRVFDVWGNIFLNCLFLRDFDLSDIKTFNV